MATAVGGRGIDELGIEFRITLGSFDVDLLYGVHVDNGVLHVDNLVVVREGFHSVAVCSKLWGFIGFDHYLHILRGLCADAVFGSVEDIQLGTWRLFFDEVLDRIQSG